MAKFSSRDASKRELSVVSSKSQDLDAAGAISGPPLLLGLGDGNQGEPIRLLEVSLVVLVLLRELRIHTELVGDGEH